jgi:hypothetical protein
MTQQTRTFMILCPCQGVKPIFVNQYEEALTAQCPHCGRYRLIPRKFSEVRKELQKAEYARPKRIEAG